MTIYNIPIERTLTKEGTVWNSFKPAVYRANSEHSPICIHVFIYKTMKGTKTDHPFNRNVPY